MERRVVLGTFKRNIDPLYSLLECDKSIDIQERIFEPYKRRIYIATLPNPKEKQRGY